MTDYTFILSRNYSDKQWSINGDDYDGLIWLDESPKPSREQLDQEYQDYKDNYEYLDKRANAYLERGVNPDSKANALWESLVNSNQTLVNQLQQIIAEVDAQYPAPVQG